MTQSIPIHDVDELLRHSDWIRALARRLVRDEAEQDDLVQETWLAALTGRPAVVADMKGWLTRVIRNAFLQRQRSGRRRHKRERAAASPEQVTIRDVAAEAEQQRELVGTLLALDEPYRGALLQKYFEDLSAAEIAARAGIPSSTVRSRLNRGLLMLRDRYDQRFNGNRQAWVGLLMPLIHRGDAAGSISLKIAAGALLMNLKFASIVAVVAVAGISTALWMTDDDPGDPQEPAAVERAAAHATGDAPPSAATTEQAKEVLREEVPIEPPAAPAAVRKPDRAGLVGTVDHATGKQTLLSGARVTVLSMDEEKRYQRTEHVVYSDEHGAFYVPEEVPRDGSCKLLAELRGYAPHQRPFMKDVAPLLRLEPSAVVYGRVVNRDTGNPIAGAVVQRWGQMGSFARPMVTDATGQYRFDDARTRGTFRFSVQAPRGYRVTQHLDLAGPGEYRKDVSIAFGPLVRGRVTDLETGHPIAAADVTIDFTPACTTDDAGAFELFLPPDRAITLAVKAEGYCTTGRKFDPTQLSVDSEARFPLVRACILEGIVLDFEGRPMRGVFVSASEIRTDPTRKEDPGLSSVLPQGTMINPVGSSSCETDEAGRFALTRLRPNVVYESIRAFDQEAGRSTRAGPFTFSRPGEIQSTSVQFRVAAEIHGRVTWNGEPVRATIEAAGDRGKAVAGDDGSYHLELTEAGPVEIYARVRSPRMGQSEKIHVVPGEQRQLDFAFGGDLNRVEGRLLTTSGQPVPRVIVGLCWNDKPFTGRSGVSGEDGRFTADLPLAQGQSFTASLMHGPAHVKREGLIVGGPPFDITLPDIGKAYLRVLDADTDAPLTRIECQWRVAGTDEYRDLSSRHMKQQPDGTLVLTLPVGLVDLRVNRRRSEHPGVVAGNVRSAVIPDPTPVVVRLPSK